jgi:hypothetical protein
MVCRCCCQGCFFHIVGSYLPGVHSRATCCFFVAQCVCALHNCAQVGSAALNAAALVLMLAAASKSLGSFGMVAPAWRAGSFGSGLLQCWVVVESTMFNRWWRGSCWVVWLASTRFHQVLYLHAHAYADSCWKVC